jgi:hypothetical protein
MRLTIAEVRETAIVDPCLQKVTRFELTFTTLLGGCLKRTVPFQPKRLARTLVDAGRQGTKIERCGEIIRGRLVSKIRFRS